MFAAFQMPDVDVDHDVNSSFQVKQHSNGEQCSTLLTVRLLYTELAPPYCVHL